MFGDSPVWRQPPYTESASRETARLSGRIANGSAPSRPEFCDVAACEGGDDRASSAGAVPTAAKSATSFPKKVLREEGLVTGRQRIGKGLRIEGSAGWNVNQKFPNSSWKEQAIS